MTPPVVAIARLSGADPIGIFERAMADSGFRAHCLEVVGRKTEPRAVIVPALDARSAASPVATDPRLVEHLIDVLSDLGFVEVVVGSTRDSTCLWLENRDPCILADLLGYRYETPAGRTYDVIDLAENQIDGGFSSTSTLAGTSLSHEWVEADLRIVFASNRTDEEDGYSLCLSTLLSVLPLADKDYHYRHRRDRGEVIAALETAAPAHFAFIDAVRSAHGPGGSNAPRDIATDTVIAAPGAALADHYGALLMGLDPFVSGTAAPAMRRPGLLDQVTVIGSLDRYSSWINVQPDQREAAVFRDRSVAISRSVRPLIAEVDRSLFSFTNPVIDRVNGVVAPLLAAAAERGDGHLLALLNYWLGQIGFAADAWATHFDKDSLYRVEAPIDVAPASILDAEFDGIAKTLFPLADMLSGTPADSTGLRWRTHDGAILFDGARRYPIPFEHFVASVEIHRTIQFMNDYIGGEACPLARDKQGRVTRQIERNLYLPQPNFTILFGGTVIDVTKIETVSYAPQRHQMVWKSIGSANDSTLADDGIVTFEALGEDTLVSIFGRQLFRLPPLLDAAALDLVPDFKALLVTDAYQRFFRRSFANLEAVAEGRDIRIGRPWSTDDAGEPLPIEQLFSYAQRLVEGANIDPKNLVDEFMARPFAAPIAERIDSDGFHHFDTAPLPSGPRRGLLAGIAVDLRHAARVDVGLAR